MTMRWLVSFLLVSGLTAAPAASRPAEPRTRPGTLTGVVTDSDGQAVAGIPLWAIGSPEQKYRDLPPSAVSGPDGSFSIPGLRPGEIELHACGPRHLHTSRLVWFLDEPVHLVLEPGAVLRGRVLAPDDAPVEGLGLFARKLPWFFRDPHSIPPPPWSPCPSHEWAIWEDGGRFELGPLEAGEYGLEAYMDGLTQETFPVLQLSPGQELEGIEIRLRSDGSREGRLIEPAGAPFPSAHVTIADEDGEYASDYSWDGTFRYTPRKAGPVTLRVEAKGYEVLERTIDPAVEADPVELLLVRDESWKTVRGRVVGPEGHPVEGAEVFFLGSGPETQSAADGSFELKVLMEYSLTLHVVKEGFAGGWLDVDLDAPPVVEGTIRLEPGAMVSGRVLGCTPGDLGPETLLRLRRSEGPDLDALLQADDTFRFERVPSGVWELELKTRYRSARKSVVVRPGQTEVAADLSLPPLVPVSGRVLDSRGQPLAGVLLIASQDDNPAAAGGTRRDGSFVLHVPKGDVELTASHPGFLDGSLEISVGQRPVKKRVIRLEPEPELDLDLANAEALPEEP